ncbi:MAG: SpoIVB peptidase [Oscillospiraceae bacterium]
MKRKFLAMLTIAGMLLFPSSACLYYHTHLADQYYTRKNETLELSTVFPVTAEPSHIVTAVSQNGDAVQETVFRLFGIFPIKTAEIQPISEVRLVPCGQPFGVRMLMDGIMVIGFGEVAGKSGHCCPAVSAGLQEGDIIRQANDTPIQSTADFRGIVAQGEKLSLLVERNGESMEISLKPEYSLTEQCFQTGLWVRDSTAGIGTLTYFEPETGYFGGLGHPICDPDTGEMIPLASGEADMVTISGAIAGSAGIAGQLQGYFSGDAPIGTLYDNSRYGVFGKLNQVPNVPSIPMALKQEITLGEAVILTTVSGDIPQAYTVEIVSIDYTDDTRNMVIEVTDERLLQQTGGIVQGMSGSPLLQNGRMIGAVTHVFVSNPAQGYGIFAENMYQYMHDSAFAIVS